jgi:hypothetical protein
MQRLRQKVLDRLGCCQSRFWRSRDDQKVAAAADDERKARIFAPLAMRVAFSWGA